MRIWIFLLPVYLFASVILKAQEGSLLWKVESPQCKTSYLFGTIHLLPQKDFLISDKVKKALYESHTLAMELDMSDPNMSMQMMKYATMRGDTTISMLLGDSLSAALNKILMETVGMGLPMVEKMKPFILSGMLIGRLIEGEPASFELSLTQMALADSMKIVGLETVAEQMAVFDSIPYTVQAESLVEMVGEEEEMRGLYTTMVEAYKAEDLQALAILLDENLKGESEEEMLLERRNLKWIPQMEKLMLETPVFFAVGAGHLSGKYGLIELLRLGGYKVSPVLD